jgi:hypothetical protein
MFFLNFGAMHALLEYYELTKDPVLAKAMIQYFDAGQPEMVGGGKSVPYGPILAHAFAARYAPDAEKYRQSLSERMHTMYRTAYQTFPEDRSHWTGPLAPVIHFPIALFWLNYEGYTMTALPQEPRVTEEEMANMRAKAVYEGKGSQLPVDRESWQTEFNADDLKSYCRPSRPLEP